VIRDEAYEALKQEIMELDEYKPLLVFRRNGKYVALGGNKRLLIFQEIGRIEVDISIVKPKNEVEKIKYLISDNDTKGEWDRQALAELIQPHIEEISLDTYRIQTGKSEPIKNVVEEFGPDINPEQNPEGRIQITPELYESHNYVILYFDNDLDWLTAKEVLGLKEVRRLSEKLGDVGIGRVIKGSDVIKRMT
jgi:hypothetical protein